MTALCMVSNAIELEPGTLCFPLIFSQLLYCATRSSTDFFCFPAFKVCTTLVTLVRVKVYTFKSYNNLHGPWYRVFPTWFDFRFFFPLIKHLKNCDKMSTLCVHVGQLWYSHNEMIQLLFIGQTSGVVRHGGKTSLEIFLPEIVQFWTRKSKKLMFENCENIWLLYR